MTSMLKLLSLLLCLGCSIVATPLTAQPADTLHSTTASATALALNAETSSIAEQVHGDDTASSRGFVAKVLHFYDRHMNYITVCALMTLESSFIPFPSEVVIPPAVYVSLNPATESHMVPWLIVLIGTLGALLGALINYYLSMWLGRPIIYKFADSKLGHLLQLSGAKIDRAEAYFNKHGVWSTLIGRMIPVIRQFISIPAGLAKMNIGVFILCTTAGALLWSTVLGLLGWLAYRAADPSVIERYSHLLSIIIIAIVCVAAVWLIIRSIIKRRKRNSITTDNPSVTDK